MCRYLIGLICIMVLLFPTNGFSEIVADQCYDARTATQQCSWAINARDVEIAQTFSVGTAGTLNAVDVWICNGWWQPANCPDLYWDVRPTSKGAPLASNSSVLASGVTDGDVIPTNLFSQGPLRLDTNAFNIVVNPDDVLAVTVRVHSQYINWLGEAAYGNLGTSFARHVYDPNGPWTPSPYGTSWLGFATYINTVPEPSSLVLFVIVSISLLGFSWIRKRKVT